MYLDPRGTYTEIQSSDTSGGVVKVWQHRPASRVVRWESQTRRRGVCVLLEAELFLLTMVEMTPIGVAECYFVAVRVLEQPNSIYYTY